MKELGKLCGYSTFEREDFIKNIWLGDKKNPSYYLTKIPSLLISSFLKANFSEYIPHITPILTLAIKGDMCVFI